MTYRGISYDVGTFFVKDVSTRPEFDSTVVASELDIIVRDLHCNAIRIFGQDVKRLMAATEQALERGLSVWLSPMLVDATSEETVEYIKECAKAFEEIRKKTPTNRPSC